MAARLAAGAPPGDPRLARARALAPEAGASATAPVCGGAGANPVAQACVQHKECTESRRKLTALEEDCHRHK
eukprot:4369279-Alexandrium_andersonii.AAC.1